MDVDKVVEELKQERDLVDGAIRFLEQLKYDRRNRRGRPPAWLKQMQPPLPHHGPARKKTN